MTLHFREAGHGRPLLLLHAFPLTGESFAPQLSAPPKGHRLIVPDHRGFGGSAPGEGPTTMEAIAQDSLALLDRLGVREPLVVGGVSMGGYAAMAMARLDPGRVRALILIDTQPTADDEQARAGREETAQKVERDGVETLVQSLLPRLLAPGAPEPLRAEVARMIRQSPPKGVAAALRGMALRADSRELLSRFAGPALVVVGKEDAITPPAKARQLAGLLSGGQLVELEGAGHLSHLEVPRAFNAALEGFLARA